MEADLIKHFFPVELLDHFEYRSSKIKMGEHGAKSAQTVPSIPRVTVPLRLEFTSQVLMF